MDLTEHCYHLETCNGWWKGVCLLRATDTAASAILLLCHALWNKVGKITDFSWMPKEKARSCCCLCTNSNSHTKPMRGPKKKKKTEKQKEADSYEAVFTSQHLQFRTTAGKAHHCKEKQTHKTHTLSILHAYNSPQCRDRPLGLSQDCYHKMHLTVSLNKLNFQYFLHFSSSPLKCRN